VFEIRKRLRLKGPPKVRDGEFTPGEFIMGFLAKTAKSSLQGEGHGKVGGPLRRNLKKNKVCGHLGKTLGYS
jgi:hypothetical protein